MDPRPNRRGLRDAQRGHLLWLQSPLEEALLVTLTPLLRRPEPTATPSSRSDAQGGYGQGSPLESPDARSPRPPGVDIWLHSCSHVPGGHAGGGERGLQSVTTAPRMLARVAKNEPATPGSCRARARRGLPVRQTSVWASKMRSASDSALTSILNVRYVVSWPVRRASHYCSPQGSRPTT